MLLALLPNHCHQTWSVTLGATSANTFLQPDRKAHSEIHLGK